MPHKCTKCGETVEDSSDKIINGCPNCRNKKWEFISNNGENKSNEPDKVQDVLNEQYEGIKIVRDGHYKIDIGELYRGDSHMIKIGEDGSYEIADF